MSNIDQQVVYGNEWEAAGDALLYTRRNRQDVLKWRDEGVMAIPIPLQTEVQIDSSSIQPAVE